MIKTAAQIAYRRYCTKLATYDITSLADKWSERDHLIAALEEHIKDTRKSIGKENEQKELMDLALITEAYRRSQVPKDVQRARWAKFQGTASYPSLAAQKA